VTIRPTNAKCRTLCGLIASFISILITHKKCIYAIQKELITTNTSKMREKYFDSLKHLEVVYRLVLQASNKFINLREKKKKKKKSESQNPG
jgi:hypothetical protein